jgi:TolB-like protein/class 3 adenylate cyclase/Tfp pilus assembly protein PilF
MTIRRLAAILAADVVGFSAMMERDEEGTLAGIKSFERDLLEPRVRSHQGRIVKKTGDGYLIEFASPLEAVRCALAIQEELGKNGAPEVETPLRLRIGINLGDIIIDADGDIYGDDVNVARRLEQLAEPGGLCVSGKVADEVEGKIEVPLQDRGEHQVKNISRPMRVFAIGRSEGIAPAGATAPAVFKRTGPLRRADERRIAAAVRDYLARERISREQFAFKTKLGKSTVDKLLTGLFSERTLAIVESHTSLPLRQMLTSETAAPRETPAPAPSPKALGRPSLAVMPFANMSGDPEQDYLADGIAEDLITAFARLRWLFVIARNSSFAYKGKAVDLRQVAQELGVRYVLEGSVRTAGGRLRVTAQLIDAETGKHIWAERYDRELRDLFAVQDEITERVVAVVEPHLYAEEGFRAASKPPDSVDAWGLVARAVVMLNKFDREQNMEAQTLLRRAIALEPSYARAHAVLGWAIYWATYSYWLPDRDESVRQAAAHAQVALQHDPTDPWARMVYGLCLSSIGQHERALGELQAALTLNPSFALGHIVFGWALLRAGHFDEALVETGWALRMSPVDSFAGFYTTVHGLALLAARQFEEALPYLRASIAAAEHSGQYHSLISCCGHLGLIEEAQEYIAARNRLGPPVRLSVLRRNLAHFAHRDIFIEGLKKAGVPE